MYIPNFSSGYQMINLSDQVNWFWGKSQNKAFAFLCMYLKLYTLFCQFGNYIVGQSLPAPFVNKDSSSELPPLLNAGCACLLILNCPVYHSHSFVMPDLIYAQQGPDTSV